MVTIKELTRKRILRIHGSILILVGIALTINSTAGTYLGIGKLSFLQDNEFALVGLFQAYLLMAIIGIALWIGTESSGIRKFHVVGALAHIPPLIANIMFWHLFSAMDMTAIATGGTTFHVLFICVESYAGISTTVNNHEEKSSEVPNQLDGSLKF